MGIESYCVSCEENGKTNVLMTRIPFFREVIVMSFLCQHCGFRSSEVQAAGTQPKGCKFELVVATPKVCHAWAAPHYHAAVSMWAVGSNFKLGTLVSWWNGASCSNGAQGHLVPRASVLVLPVLPTVVGVVCVVAAICVVVLLLTALFGCIFDCCAGIFLPGPEPPADQVGQSHCGRAVAAV